MNPWMLIAGAFTALLLVAILFLWREVRLADRALDAKIQPASPPRDAEPPI